MTMPTGLLEWGQAGAFNAIDDRSVLAGISASDGGLNGLLIAPTMTAGTGLVVNLGPWMAIADCGDGTKAMIGSRAAATFNETAGGASARADVLWADISPDSATWTLSLISEAAMVGRAGAFLGLILVPASASTSAAMDLRPGNARVLGPRLATFPGNTVASNAWTRMAAMTVPAYDAQVGAVYELEMWGNGTNPGASKLGLGFRVSFGGQVMSASFTFGTTAFTGGAFRAWVQARVICQAIGTTGQWISFMNGIETDTQVNVAPGNNNFGAATFSESTGFTTQDTTLDATFSVDAQWTLGQFVHQPCCHS